MVFISIFIGLDMVMGRLRLGTVEGLVTLLGFRPVGLVHQGDRKLHGSLNDAVQTV